MAELHHLFYQSEKDGKWTFYNKNKSDVLLEADFLEEEFGTIRNVILFIEEDQLEATRQNLDKNLGGP